MGMAGQNPGSLIMLIYLSFTPFFQYLATLVLQISERRKSLQKVFG
jgi:hypothetical protein